MSKDLYCIERITDTRWELPDAPVLCAGRRHVGNQIGKSKFPVTGSNGVDKTVSGVSGSCTVEVASCIQ